RLAQHPRGPIEGGRVKPLRNATSRGIDQKWRRPLCELRKVVEQDWIGVDHATDGVEAEDRFADEALGCRGRVLSLERQALRPLEDEVGGHQAWGDRTAGQVVHLP